MNIPFGATTPASGFNFFTGQKPVHRSNSKKANGISKIADKKPTGGSGHTPKSARGTSKDGSRHMGRGRNEDKEHGSRRPKLARISSIDNARIGSLAVSPQQLGFHKMSHKPRLVPRFLISQQPQLKSKEFVQDPWDAANQQKMLQLESNIEDFSELYETLKKMRDVERKVMENKQLVDKADSAKDLAEAIVFQGTCQDMCPIFERARRNVEYTVYAYEKNDPEDKKAARNKALKVFSRPAAAAAPPLPSDVRPPYVLVKTLDYIVDNLLTSLPQSEGFLWDRMRSIRQDFTYQNYSGPEAVDCNERIVRIHLLIIHIMAKNRAEYSLQQELEQLHKSLITLSEIYDEVRASGGSCPNEAEFRAYALLSKIRDPEYDKGLERLPSRIFQDDLVQQAVCFRRIVSNSNYVERGIIRTENGLNFYQRFFQLIKAEKVPFLMCSFLELYINEVRFYAFKALSYSVNKKHKSIPFQYFLENLLFNNKEELLEFCKYYSVEVTLDGVELKTLMYNSHRIPEKQPLRQPYLTCVDNLLQDSTFRSVINSGKSNNDSIPDQGYKLSTSDNQTELAEGRQYGLGSEMDTDAGVEADMGDEQMENLEMVQDFSRKLEKPAPRLISPLTPSEVAEDQLPSKRTVPKIKSATKLSENQTTVFRQPQSGFGNKKILTSVEPEPPSLQPEQTFNVLENNQEHMLPLAETLKTKEAPWNVLKKQNNGNRKEAASALTDQVVKEVVHGQATAALQHSLQRGRRRQAEIRQIADVLYHAFIHEKLYMIFLDSRAQIHCNDKLKRKFLTRWKARYISEIQRKEYEQRKKQDIRKVERQLGVPIFKQSFTKTPSNYDACNSSFTLSTSHKKDVTFSPVNNEVNKFDTQVGKQAVVWEPLPIKEMYFKKISCKFPFLSAPNKADVFIYGKHWNSICGSWMVSKFGLSNSERSCEISDGRLIMKLHCIDSYYNPSAFDNVQLLLFNTGVTDLNIFDLELKLQQDGEELIKLITGISLNTNICFSLLVVYWESAETPLAESVVSKCLKLNRIAKSFSSVLEEIGTININSNIPHRVLENGLVGIANHYRPQLTDRGRYDRNLREKRSTYPDPQLLTTKVIDERMRHMHESEEKKLRRTHDERNTYAHLQSHIAASPKLKKRKLPVLLSKNKDSRFETPQAKRTASSSSSTMFSHLAVKLGGCARFSSFSLAPATPSHSTNLPLSLLDCQETPPISNSQEHSELREPALFQTPVNSTTTTSNQYAQNSSVSQSSSPAVSRSFPQNIPNSILELKNLIESVKSKVNVNNVP